MTKCSLFRQLERIHQTHTRVRWRYYPRSSEQIAKKDIILAVRNLTGVQSARINSSIHSLIVEFDAQQTNVDTLETALLTLELPHPLSASKAHVINKKNTAGVLRSFVTLAATQGLPNGLQMPTALATTAPLLWRALNDLHKNNLTSHVLEALAVSISIARQDYLAANTTNFMLALGEYLEESIARRSEELLKYLIHPTSSEVWVEHEGNEVLTAADQVRIGDTVIVGTGTVIPIDGTVLGGEATINEASMTGESIPVVKTRGDTVLSGTLIEEGRIRVYAEHVGTKTAAARIADYVEQSLSAKSKTQLQAAHLADRLVPVVLGLAGTTLLFSQSWDRTASILQADYSCALKLATPVTFKSSMYTAGKNGILFKGATALERLAEADTFIFDKTGTLTTGQLEVTDSITLDKMFTPDDLICLAASVEEHYFHPLAVAVVTAAQASSSRHFDHAEVEFVVAHGVASEINHKRVVIGSRHFVEEDEKINVSIHDETINRLYQQGKTLLYIGYGGSLIGLIALKDQLRDNSAEIIKRLHSLGVKRILMLTGDHCERATELAKILGINEFYAELLPEDKAAIIEKMKTQGARIAFIGDGINDAPALTGAHVGIAMQRGADIARMSADVALLEDDIARVADAKAIANRAMQLISTNYRLAVSLNTAILGAAALGALRPIGAAALHNGTTIAILLNALLSHKNT